jgi:hypothetical protein
MLQALGFIVLLVPFVVIALVGAGKIPSDAVGGWLLLSFLVGLVMVFTGRYLDAWSRQNPHRRRSRSTPGLFSNLGGQRPTMGRTNVTYGSQGYTGGLTGSSRGQSRSQLGNQTPFGTQNRGSQSTQGRAHNQQRNTRSTQFEPYLVDDDDDVGYPGPLF